MAKYHHKKFNPDWSNTIAKLFGLAMGLIGLLILYWVPVTILTCRYVETTQVDCLLKQRLLGLIPVGEMSITHLQSAYVSWDTQTGRNSSDNREYTYSVSKVILVTPSGEITLNDYADPSITLGNSERIATKINDFLAVPTAESLTVWQAIWLPLLVGGCFSSLLVLWVVGLLVGAGIRLKQSWPGGRAGIGRIFYTRDNLSCLAAKSVNFYKNR
jgi:hypothetical protein